jgi:5-methylcytosine-specific restriction protein A
MRIHFLPSEASFRDEIASAIMEDGSVHWTCPKDADIGDPVYFIVLGDGVIAKGNVDSKPRRARKSSRFSTRYFADIVEVQPLKSTVSLRVLTRRFPRWGYPRYPRTYTTIIGSLANRVGQLLERYENRNGVSRPKLSLFREGRKRVIKLTSYERNKAARTACLSHWGYKCDACGFSFGESYGPQFADCIHVHHLRPMAAADGPRRINPKKEMRPLCPNCHLIAHQSDPPVPIARIKALLKKYK